MPNDPDAPEQQPDAGSHKPEPSVKPSQIPLLDDVFAGEQPRQSRKNKRDQENIELPLDPRPPRTPDLFAEQTWSAAAYVAAITTDKANPAHEAMLRDQAGDIVESLVQEYSKEIIRSLREELTALLDELERDTPPFNPQESDPSSRRTPDDPA